MEQVNRAAGFRSAICFVARFGDHHQRFGAAGHGLAGNVEPTARAKARSTSRCRVLSGDAAGFGLTEVLVSAVLLGIFSSAGLQLSGSIGRAAQQQQQSAAQQHWLALQLQRDAGLLIRQGFLPM